MYWLSRPPLMRWVAAGALLLGALFMDLSERRTVPFPFAATAIAAGAVVDASHVAWRDVPDGLLGDPPAIEGVAAHAIRAGEPLVAGALRVGDPVAPGWWSVPVAVPADATVGTRVRLVADHPPVDVEGVVTRPSGESTFSVPSPGMVAVPPDEARAVADAVRNGTLIVLVGT